MKVFFRNNAPYLVGYAILLAAMIFALLAMPKAELHLWLNGCHAPWLDCLMRAVTYLPQWPIYALMLCFIVRRYAVVAYYLVSELAATVLVQVLKAAFNMPRPVEYFSQAEQAGCLADFRNIVVSGLGLHHWHSFPSGHTQTFFVCATVLALLIAGGELLKEVPAGAKKCLPLVLLFIAALGGYSRIYLSQHFCLDVAVGSLIGVVVPFLCWPLYLKFEAKWPGRGLCYNYFPKKQ